MAIISVGDKILFHGTRQWYTVKAKGDRYAVCTKPFAPRKTVIYSIIDFQKQIRGTENAIFCMGFETDQQCQEALARLESGETEVSHRNRVPLDIANIKPPYPSSLAASDSINDLIARVCTIDPPRSTAR